MTLAMPCRKAVILARGLGTRMRASDDSVALAPDQRAAADTGDKAMIRVGRPFLDYALSGLADAGFTRLQLMSTLAGEPLYTAYGFEPVERLVDATGGVPVPLVRMEKPVTPRA